MKYLIVLFVMLFGVNLDSKFSDTENLRVWYGSVQSDDACLYLIPMAECLESENTYEVMWVPVDELKFRSGENISILIQNFNEYRAGENENFTKYILEVSLIPLEELKNEFDMNINFPTNISVYKKEQGEYVLLEKDIEVVDFDSYTKLKSKILCPQL